MARRKLSSEMNVVPYIDVMLVLLVIFMVTAPLLTQGIEVDLPDVNAASMTSQQEDRILSVNEQGQLLLNFGGDTKTPLSPEEVRTRVQELLAKEPDQMILVEGDQAVPYQHVAEAMALLGEVGVKRIGFVTSPPQDGERQTPTRNETTR